MTWNVRDGDLDAATSQWAETQSETETDTAVQCSLYGSSIVGFVRSVIESTRATNSEAELEVHVRNGRK